MIKNYSFIQKYSFKIILLLAAIIFNSQLFSQNVGVGTTSPTNSFHVVRAPGNPNPDPLRVEDLRQSVNDTAFLVINNQGVVKYINFSVLRNNINGNIDSLIIATLINNTDTLFSSQSFSDSLRGFIFNNADTLFSNQPWLDSLAVLLKDSIDSDVDSLVVSPLDSLYLYEDGKRISVYLPDLDSTNELLDSIYLSGDSLVFEEGGITHYVNIAAIIDSFETVTALTSTDSTLTYTDENGISSVIDIQAMVDSVETVTSISFTDSTIIYIDEDGISTTIDVKAMVDSLETQSTLVDNGDGTFTYTDERGVVTTFNSKDTVLTYFNRLNDSTLYYV
ncbi:MAG: hypothetical protein ACPGVD_10620, partial [Flavobacteriales bacterium]